MPVLLNPSIPRLANSGHEQAGEHDPAQTKGNGPEPCFLAVLPTAHHHLSVGVHAISDPAMTE